MGRKCKKTQNGPGSHQSPGGTHQTLWVEVRRRTGRRHSAVVTTGLARQGGAPPTEGRPSLGFLAGNTGDGAHGTHIPRRSAPREAGMTPMDPITEEKAEACARGKATGPETPSLLAMKPTCTGCPLSLLSPEWDETQQVRSTQQDPPLTVPRILLTAARKKGREGVVRSPHLAG